MAGREPEMRYADLEQLSTQDLEAILAGDLASPEGEDPGLVDAVLEVLAARAKADPDSGLPDAERARREFDALYRDLEEPLYAGEEEPKGKAAPPAARPAFRRRSWRRVLLAAALIALLAAMTMVPAFGYANVLQAVAYWTAEQFSFQTVDLNRDSEQVLDEYAELKKAADENHIIGALIPQYIPEGFEVTELDFYPADDTSGFLFAVLYKNGEEIINYDILQTAGLNGGIYEKDKGDVECYVVGGMEHYLFTNNGDNVAVWYVDGVECSISTTLPKSELKKIVDSIYEEYAEMQSAGLTAGQAEQGRTGDLPEEYAEVRAALEERGITSFTVPGYIPEGFQVTETDLFISSKDCVDFTITYGREEDYFYFDILQYSQEVRVTYEKTDDPVEIYERGGVEHYIFSNIKSVIAAWRVGELEYSIGTSLPVSELKKIIDSMYEE